MAKEIVNTEIRPQGGKLHALAHWQNGEEQGTDKKVFDDFNEAQAWLNDQQTATPEGNPQAQSVHAAASHNLTLVIDQLESVRHNTLTPFAEQLKTIRDELSKIEL
jgi:hypothetical protein